MFNKIAPTNDRWNVNTKQMETDNDKQIWTARSNTNYIKGSYIRANIDTNKFTKQTIISY